MATFTKDELTKKPLADLKELAEENSIDIEGLKKADIIDALLELEDELDDELEDEVELDEEDELEAEDDDLEEEVDEPAPKKSAAKKPAAKPAAKKPASDDDSPTLAAKQVATILGTEAKTLRQFFRSPVSTVEAVGSGGRYEFLESDVPQIKEEFEKWRSAHAARGSKRGPGKKASTPVEEIEEVEDIEELEELDLEDEELELEEED